jgi:hypothetical protein
MGLLTRSERPDHPGAKAISDGGSLRLIRFCRAAEEQDRSQMKFTAGTIAASLNVSERLLLSCIATDSDWAGAGITNDRVANLVSGIRGSACKAGKPPSTAQSLPRSHSNRERTILPSQNGVARTW